MMRIRGMGSRIVLLLLALLALHAVADEGEGESMGLPVVTDSSVVGVAAPRLTLIRPVNSTAVFNAKGQIIHDPRDHDDVSLLLLGSFSEGDEIFFTESNKYCDNTKLGMKTNADGTAQGFAIKDISEDGTRGYITLQLYVQDNVNMVLYVCINEDHQSGGTYDKLEFTTIDIQFAVLAFDLSLSAKIIIIIVLLLLSGLFSGLNLGLMALNVRELEIYSTSGTVVQQGYSKAILPLRRRGNLLLCTVLIG